MKKTFIEWCKSPTEEKGVPAFVPTLPVTKLVIGKYSEGYQYNPKTSKVKASFLFVSEQLN